MNIFQSSTQLIGKIFGVPLWFLFDLFNNYGLAVIALTIIITVMMFPLEVKRVKSMARAEKITKKTNEISTKYANNKQKRAEEIAKLYEEEGNPMSGNCMPSIIPLVTFMGILGALSHPLSLMFNMSSEKITAAINSLSNIPIIGTGYQHQYVELHIVKMVSRFSTNFTMFDVEDLRKITEFNEGTKFLGVNLLDIPGECSFQSLMWMFPVLCVVTALIPIIFAKKLGIAPPATPGPGQGCMKIMPYTLVIPFIFVTYWAPAALGLYYIVSNILRPIQSYIVKKFFNINILNAKDEFARVELLQVEESKVRPDYSIKGATDTNNITKINKR